MLLFVLYTIVFPPLVNSNHVFVSVSTDFSLHSYQETSFYCIACEYSCADWCSLFDHLRDVPWEEIFKLSLSAAGSEFCKWIQIGIGVYIPHQKYQVKSSSLGWQTENFAATHDKFRGKFTRAYNPRTLGNLTKSKILPFSLSKLVIWAVKKVSFLHVLFFGTIHLPLLITLHSTEQCKHKNDNKKIHHVVPIN